MGKRTCRLLTGARTVKDERGSICDGSDSSIGQHLIMTPSSVGRPTDGLNGSKVMKNKTSFNWQCAHCGKRTIDIFRYQFDVPKDYRVEVDCTKCGKETRIHFSLSVEAIRKKAKNDGN